MNESTYPAGWDAERVQRVIDAYENMSEDEMAAEDEAALAAEGLVMMPIPGDLVAEVQALIARRQSA